VVDYRQLDSDQKRSVIDFLSIDAAYDDQSLFHVNEGNWWVFGGVPGEHLHSDPEIMPHRLLQSLEECKDIPQTTTNSKTMGGQDSGLEVSKLDKIDRQSGRLLFR